MERDEMRAGEGWHGSGTSKGSEARGRMWGEWERPRQLLNERDAADGWVMPGRERERERRGRRGQPAGPQAKRREGEARAERSWARPK